MSQCGGMLNSTVENIMPPFACIEENTTICDMNAESFAEKVLFEEFTFPIKDQKEEVVQTFYSEICQ